MDGHANVLGGCIVDGGTFDWAASGKFPELTEPDESYHGVVYTNTFGKGSLYQQSPGAAPAGLWRHAHAHGRVPPEPGA